MYEGPGTYVHFRGDLYEVLGVAMHTETVESLVIYKSEGENLLYARSLRIFNEHVNEDGRPSFPSDDTLPRFQIIGD